MSESGDELVDDLEDEESEDQEESEEESEDEKFVEEVSAWEDEETVLEHPTDFSDGKFETTHMQHYLNKHHPEMKAYTYEEMQENMAQENPTLQFLTRYEVTSLLGYRTLQLNHGAEPIIETDLTDSYQIAKKELEMGKLPFIVRRPLPNGSFVHVRCSELEYFV
jgi:DNA-directed RNA polymerase I, II, and III subunit RPABC2